MKSAAVILAAGRSSRFGKPKQLLRWRGETLVQRACRIAIESGHDVVMLVVAAPCADFGPLPEAVIRLVNDKSGEGMGSSLALAAAHAREVSAETLTVILPDQPAVSGELLQRLRSGVMASGCSIALCRSGSLQGPPSCFRRQHFNSLAKLEGDEGGKAIVQAHCSEVALIEAPESAWDVDTPALWARFRGRERED